VPVEIAGIVNALTSDLVPHKHAWLISGQETTLAALCVVQSVSVLCGSVNSPTSWPRQQPYAAKFGVHRHICGTVHLVAPGLVSMMLHCVTVNIVVLVGLTGMHKTGCSGETRLALHVLSSS